MRINQHCCHALACNPPVPALSCTHLQTSLLAVRPPYARHFAGDVHYSTAGILDKNRDKLPDELRTLLAESSMPLVASLFPPPEEPEDLVAPGAPRYNTPSGQRKGSGSPNKKTSTIVSQFQKQLRALMASLEPTLPHFVRCIKPNALKRAQTFDPVMVFDQLTYSGIALFLCGFLFLAGRPAPAAAEDCFTAR